jgi:hypothetical protein
VRSTLASSGVRSRSRSPASLFNGRIFAGALFFARLLPQRRLALVDGGERAQTPNCCPFAADRRLRDGARARLVGAAHTTSAPAREMLGESPLS